MYEENGCICVGNMFVCFHFFTSRRFHYFLRKKEHNFFFEQAKIKPKQLKRKNKKNSEENLLKRECKKQQQC